MGNKYIAHDDELPAIHAVCVEVLSAALDMAKAGATLDELWEAMMSIPLHTPACVRLELAATDKDRAAFVSAIQHGLEHEREMLQRARARALIDALENLGAHD